MNVRNLLVGKYWNPEHVMDAMKRFKEADIRVFDVYAPFPIHGIEPYLGIKRTRLSLAAFIYGVIGFTIAVLAMSSIFGIFWPMDVGGKPNLPWPSFVPITFEMTVFFSAHGMVITFFAVAQYWPGKKARLLDDRQTDDVFVVAIDKKKLEDEAGAKSILQETGAFEITEKELETYV